MERTLDQHLDHLKGELLKMGSAVEESIEQAVQSLVERDNHLVDVVEEGGHHIDDWEVEIEEECLRVLAVQQPVAGDLRLVAGIMKINYDLERINDQAVNIAQRARLLNRMPQLKPLIDIPRMAELARGMVRDALDAFVNRDVELANKVRRIDDTMDALRDQIFRELLTYLNTGIPSTVDQAILLILVSRHLERIGDHSSNIAENAVYLVQGRIVRHQQEELRVGE
ncbi:MAG: phosphate signaling complex protein PhoU [Gemmatimonadota bacterium]|nr:phosphate signaling complex protein PhoU [Gemmatimonadota bacterium]MXX13424.1 phosphate signaling complex protein PhoU [Gemmatimonadota bacterium]MYB54836.1 phosphate signaling complex protein PhoU [Gemmatimonadota bacterium]MYD61933.1 phosphate signaling complex protein PhoU [Gemmatimonadota bacterium]